MHLEGGITFSEFYLSLENPTGLVSVHLEFGYLFFVNFEAAFSHTYQILFHLQV